MTSKYQRFFPWFGPVFIVMLGVGMWPLSGLLPPMTPEEVAAFYQTNTTQIRLGVLLMFAGSAFYVPWTAIIADQIKRVPGVTNTLLYTQLGSGFFNCLFIFILMVFFIMTAFRPDRDPALTYMFNDFSWIMFLVTVYL